MKPFFSIIIPTLNEEKYLPNLLTDLSAQSFRTFEFVVVDGHSEDLTVKKALSFRRRLPSLKLINCRERHVSLQRNLGAGKASGEYLVFMDADNRLPPYYLEGLHYKLLSDNVDLFTTWCKPDSDKPGEKTITTAINFLIDAAKFIDYEGALGAMIGCRRVSFAKEKGFDPSISYAEDGEFVRRYVHAGCSFSVFHDPLFIYSLRRFRSNGTIQTLQSTATLYLKQMTGGKIARSEYPMGGHIFSKPPKSFRDKIISLQNKLNSLLESS